MGNLNLHGADVGALVPTIIIAANTVPANGEVAITDFAATADTGATDTVVFIEESTDNFATYPLNAAERARIELPTGGSLLFTYDTPIYIGAGRSFRVMYNQVAAGAVSAKIAGESNRANFVDL